MRYRKEFRGVSVVRDRHGRLRYRLRRTVKGRTIDCYLPGVFGSAEFRAAYDGVTEGVRAAGRRAQPGTVGYLIATYLGSKGFQRLASTTRRDVRRRLDWVRVAVGEAKYAKIAPHHVAKLMERKGGPAAANRLRKDLGQMFRFAARMHGFTGQNPAALADPHKTKKGGFRTWTNEEIETFRAVHATGTKARLALEILVNTGASRIDAIGFTRANIAGARIRYHRAKTGQAVDLPILPEFGRELSYLPPTQMVLLSREDGSKGYANESFGNLFRRWREEAGLSGLAAHGLRKAGARRLAEAGATEFEVMSFLGHGTAREASRYVAAANRATLADSGMAKLGAETQNKVVQPFRKVGQTGVLTK